MSFIEKRKRVWGDRKDGHRVKDAPAMNKIMSLLYPNRCECQVSATTELDITDLLAFLREKNAANPERELKFFHCFVTAIVRVLNERRFLNRFVQGGEIYERDEITVSFVAKRRFQDNAEEALLTYCAKKDDTLEDVARFILGEVGEMRRTDNKKKDADASIEFVAKLPRLLRMIIVRTARTLDYWGKVPKSLTRGDPNYSTVLLANLGSIRCPSAHHHLNNYGTTSIMITIGTMTQKTILRPDGTAERRDVVEITSTCDERIADGFYFARSIRLLARILETPALLEKPFDEESGLEEI